MKKFDAFQIKLFMSVLMVLDHLPHIHGLLPPMWIGIFHLVTRCVSAWFAFMAVEGFLHTRNRIKYNARLFLWAGIMFAGNSLLKVILSSKDVYLGNNIFFTLALGVLILNMVSFQNDSICRHIKYRKQLLVFLKVFLIAIILAYGAIYSEGGYVLLPFMLITYLLRKNIKYRNIAYVILSVILAVPVFVSIQTYSNGFVMWDMMLFNSDWFFLSVLPFLYLYNGERGRNDRFSKYFFYIFYPLHLWIIAAISYIF